MTESPDKQHPAGVLPPPADDGVVVSVRNVSKKFCSHLRRSMAYGILDLTRSFAGVKIDGTHLRKDEFWALRHLNFDLRKGEALGLLGVNGSGKTTLLRLLTGIFPPDEGEIMIRGRLGALIAVGAGFHPNMTGRENIYLNGAVLGMSREEIRDSFQDIVEFAEIGDFIDAPVSIYSSGMRVRLGFSIATAVRPDVLLIDEILAVGDAVFRRRCFERVEKLLKDAAVILVSHQIMNIEEHCNRAIYLDKGHIVADGDLMTVTNRYMNDTYRKSARFSKRSRGARSGSGEIRFSDDVRVVGEHSGAGRISQKGEDLIVEAGFACRRPMKNISFVVALEDLTSSALLTLFECQVPEVTADGRLNCRIHNLKLQPRAYTVALLATDLKVHIDLWRNVADLVVEGDSDERVSFLKQAMLRVPYEMTIDINGTQHVETYPGHPEGNGA